MQQRKGELRINIAIDGPAGAGKSTVARMVAAKLGYIYIDTGAMYRAVTWLAQQEEVAAGDIDALQRLTDSISIRLEPGREGQEVYVNDTNVTTQIRSREVTNQVSYYAADANVRRVLADLQRELAQRKGIVMDGRDIGTHVLPDAEVKVFLTASVQERARRRYQELPDKQVISLSQLEAEIAARDKLDQEREIAPLVQASDADLLDSTSLTIDEVVAFIVQLSRTRTGESE